MNNIYRSLIISILALHFTSCRTAVVCTNTPTLGRTHERLPGTDTNAFLQYEVPLNTVTSQCSYTNGGIIFDYPINWFTQNPNVIVTIEPTAANPNDAITYSVVMTQNSAAQTSVHVYKYDTSSRCGICLTPSCTNAPTCTGPSTSFTCTLTDTTCGECNRISSCSSSTCGSVCTNCNGSCTGSRSLCNGSCDGVTTNNINGPCNGVCTNCPGTCTGDSSIPPTCRGECTQCTGTCNGFTASSINTYTCQGICSGGPSGTCTGTCDTCLTIPCTGTCNKEASCLTCNAICNGNCLQCTGSCNGISTCNGTCNGVCQSCTNCNSVIQPAGICNGVCTACVGSCDGRCLTSSGACDGLCSACTGTCNGNCTICTDTCTGIGNCAGQYSDSCNAENVSEEADDNEVIVYIYALEQPGA